jgi:hypothetical protein
MQPDQGYSNALSKYFVKNILKNKEESLWDHAAASVFVSASTR